MLAYVVIVLSVLAVISCIAARYSMHRDDKAASLSADEQTENPSANDKGARPRFYIGTAILIIMCICGLSTYLSGLHKTATEAYFGYATCDIINQTALLLASCENYDDTGSEETAWEADMRCYTLYNQWHNLRMLMVYHDLIDQYEYNMMQGLANYYYTANAEINPSDTKSTAAYLEKLSAETAELLDVMLKYSSDYAAPTWETTVMDDLIREIDGLHYFD